MTENKLKSEKAKQYLSNQNIPHYEIYSMGSDSLMGVDIIDAKQAVKIAETEAEERHTKELQTMQTAIEEGKEREVIADKILADKRKECERLEKELQELKDKAYKSFKKSCPCRSSNGICQMNTTYICDEIACCYVLNFNNFLTQLNK